jgi:hypothetical protein
MVAHNYVAAAEDRLHISLLSIDMAGGDIEAGLMLDRLRFWFKKNKSGKTKLRIQRDGKWWVAKSRSAWWDECRLKPRQVDRAAKKLIGKGLIETVVYPFNGHPTVHFTLNHKACNALYSKIIEALAAANPEEEDEQESSETILPNGDGISPNGNTLLPNGDEVSPNGDFHNRNNTGQTKEIQQDIKNAPAPKRKLTVPMYTDVNGAAINHTHPHWQGIWDAVLEAGKYSADAITDSEAKIAILVTQEIIKPLSFEAADVLYFPEWVKSQKWNIDWTINSMARHMSKVRRARLEKVAPKTYEDEAGYTPPPLVEVELTEEQKQRRADKALWDLVYADMVNGFGMHSSLVFWLNNAKWIERRGDVYIFEANGPQAYEWLTERIHDQLVTRFTGFAKRPIEVVFTLADAAPPAQAAA